MPNPSTSETPGGTTNPWLPPKDSFQFTTRWPGMGADKDYVTDEAVILYDIRNLLVDIRNCLVYLVRNS